MSKKYSVRKKTKDNLIDQLLHNRGIKTKEEKEEFLNPDFQKLHDPFLLPDMNRAANRVLEAIDKDEMIGIWSDYDADGIPGAALLHDFFKKIGFKNFINYIPDRHTEGYGLNKEGIKELQENKVKLLITIDCGIRNREEIKFANSLGMEVIVTDHHEPDDGLPEALAVVNPKRKDSKYPEKILCGAGVVWKLVEAVLEIERGPATTLRSGRIRDLKPGFEKWLLDLVALATLSDMVPLLGENRILSSFGLLVLRKNRRIGLRKLFSVLRTNVENLSEDDVAFLVAPRINAASRMGHPLDAFKLLTAENEAEAESFVRHLDNINKERKIAVANTVKEAKRKIREKFESEGEKPMIILGDPDWKPALLGLVANSIVEEFRRPVFLWGRSAAVPGGGAEIFKGSCRSDGTTDLVAVMEKTKEIFLEFGGHKMSGGFSVSFDKIHIFEETVLKVSGKLKKSKEAIIADAELELKDLSENFVSDVFKLAPFGVGNDKPLFIFKSVLPEKINRFGKNQEHLSVDLRDGESKIRAVSFFCAPDQFGDALKEGIKTNLVANIEKSFWNGSSETRLRIVDFFV